MKKTLLLQTALVAAAGLFVADVASAQVKAEPISVSLGGFMEQNFKIQDKGTNANTTQQGEGDMVFGRPNTEIWFNIRAVMDNGLKIGGRVELEGASYQSDQIDESYAFFEHDAYGRIEVGSTDRVSSKMNYFAPAAVPGIGTTAPAEASAARISPLMWYRNSGNDVQGINVYTASNRYFGSKVGKGLQLGLSYVPDGCEDDNVLGTVSSNSDVTTGGLSNALSSCNQGTGTSPFGTKTSGNLRDQVQFAGNYLETFGPVDLALFASYTRTNIEQRGIANTGVTGNSFQPGVNGLSGYALGTTLTYNVGDGSTVQLGGGFRSEEVAFNRTVAGLVQVDREEAWTVGLKYLTNGVAPGSIGIGADWWTSKNPAPAASNVAGADMDFYSIGLTYQLAAGILLYVGGGVVDYTDAVPTTSTGDIKQTFAQTGFVFNF